MVKGADRIEQLIPAHTRTYSGGFSLSNPPDLCGEERLPVAGVCQTFTHCLSDFCRLTFALF